MTLLKDSDKLNIIAICFKQKEYKKAIHSFFGLVNLYRIRL